jgi:hypothetical protein
MDARRSCRDGIPARLLKQREEAVMKWYFIFWAISLSLNGPYDSEAECVAALEKQIQNPVMRDFYDSPPRTAGICLQGIARP